MQADLVARSQPESHVNNRVMHGNYFWFRMANYFSLGKLFARFAQNFAQTLEICLANNVERSCPPGVASLAWQSLPGLSSLPKERTAAAHPP
jgi:hypothetical protein